MPFITRPKPIGMQKARLQASEALLSFRFGEEGLALMREVRELRNDELVQAIATADSPDKLRRVWARWRRPKKGRRT